jgi:MFS family permease
MGVGGAIGLPLAAWIAQNFDWHTLFWFSAGLAAVVLVTTVAFVPEKRPAGAAARLDVVGLVGLALGLSGVLIGVSKGSEWGWGAVTTVVCVIGGLAVLLFWGWYELRVAAPLIDLRTTARRPILLTNIAALLIGFGMMAQSIVVPQLLQMPEVTGYGLGQSILAAGLWMAPAGLMMMLFSPVSSTMITRFGARVTLVVGAVIVAAGYLVAVLLMDAPWQLMVASIVASAGVGVAYAAMPTLIMDNTPASEAASGVGVNALMRSVGTTVAGAVIAAILTSSTMDLGGTSIPDATAFRLCFIVGAVAAAIGAAVVLFIPRRRTIHRTTTGEGDRAQPVVAVDA